MVSLGAVILDLGDRSLEVGSLFLIGKFVIRHLTRICIIQGELQQRIALTELQHPAFLLPAIV